MANNANIRIDSENLHGLFFIKVYSVKSKNVLLYGTYRGAYDGRLILHPDSELTTALIVEAHAALVSKYPNTVWTLYHKEDSQNYKEIQSLFEGAGIQVEKE